MTAGECGRVPHHRERDFLHPREARTWNLAAFRDRLDRCALGHGRVVRP